MDDRQLCEMVAEILEAQPDELTDSSELESFAAYDSVARLSLMVGLSDFTGRPVSVSELTGLHTYGDVVRLVRSSSKNGKGS